MAGDELHAADTGWAPPEELDGFRLVRQLGRGGMGMVYLAHDDVLDRSVALKFLGAADPKAAARSRFLVEARAIARLQHPNVVGIYRVGEVLGRPYLAYEHIAGQSLDELLKPVPWLRALELVLGVARGLSAAHRRDVLHRDIKPANVMLADTGEIKLLDFGLAKLLDDAARSGGARPVDPEIFCHADAGETHAPDPPSHGAAATRVMRGPVARGSESRSLGPRGSGTEGALTAAGAIMGTPLYMAPELWRGEPASVQSDIYALGLLFYELLSGHLPHEELRASELAEAVQTSDPRPIRTLCPAVPQALADVVDRAIRRRREERFQSAEQLRDALEAIRTLYRPLRQRPGQASEQAGGPRSDASIARAEDAMHIAASFARIAPHADEFCARLYARLFEAHPELRPLFPAEMAGQRRKLFGALVAVVDNLDHPERVISVLEDLGRRHAAYGVKLEDFDAVGSALLGAIADFDAGFHDGVRAAWGRAYGQIAKAMQRGLMAERVTLPPDAAGSAANVRGDAAVTRYARSGENGVAYQVLGQGPLDLVLVTGWLTHLEAGWDWPPLARFLRSLAAFGRLIVFDVRGSGLSDAADREMLLEDRAADLRAVLDAASVERAVLIGMGDGAAAALLFAATRPERTRAVVCYGGQARTTADDGELHESSTAAHDEVIAHIRTSWGAPLFLDRLAPSLASDEAFRAFWARYLRAAAGPSAAVAHHRAGAAIDVSAVLSAVHAPALVLHRTEDAAVPIAAGRALAARLPDARFVELAGCDHLPFAGEGAAIVDEIHRFVRRADAPADASRFVAAVVAFDERAGSPVDDALRIACEREVARFGGIELGGPGNGQVAAMFDGPGRAVRFARAVLARARSLGCELAAGISFGTCWFGDTEVAGDAVRRAPRIAAHGAAGEILVDDAARTLLGSARLAARDPLPGEATAIHACVAG